MRTRKSVGLWLSVLLSVLSIHSGLYAAPLFVVTNTAGDTVFVVDENALEFRKNGNKLFQVMEDGTIIKFKDNQVTEPGAPTKGVATFGNPTLTLGVDELNVSHFGIYGNQTRFVDPSVPVPLRTSHRTATCTQGNGGSTSGGAPRADEINLFQVGVFGNQTRFVDSTAVPLRSSHRTATCTQGNGGGTSGGAPRADEVVLFSTGFDKTSLNIFDKGTSSQQQAIMLSPDTAFTEVIDDQRMLWYPVKNAFLVGQVLIQSAADVGTNSLSAGFRCKASGNYSQAFGHSTIAGGENAMAMGELTVASGPNALSAGRLTTAAGDNATAFGEGTNASGVNSTAFGEGTIASGTNSTAFGRDTQATMGRSTAFGEGTIASGTNSTAFGRDTQATMGRSTAMGHETKATADNATAMGYRTLASGGSSTAMGDSSIATGVNSTAFGHKTKALGERSTAFGYNSIASDLNSTAFGNGTIASGLNSTAFGVSTIASGLNSTAFGQNTRATMGRSTAMGDATNATANNATAMGYATLASGGSSTATGDNTTASGVNSFSMGDGTHAKGNNSAAMGYETITGSYGALTIGQFNADTTGTTDSWIATNPLLVAGNGSGVSSRSTALVLYKNGNMTIAGTLTQLSDARLKQNIRPLGQALDKINAIKPVYFAFKDQTTHPAGDHIGVIAQDVQKVFPELVQTDAQGYLSVEYANFTAVLLQAIQEQQAEIESQNTLLKQQAAELATLHAKTAELDALKKQVAVIQQTLLKLESRESGQTLKAAAGN